MNNGDRKTALKRLLSVVAEEKALLVFSVTVSVIAVALTLLVPYLTGKAIDMIIADGGSEEFFNLLIITAASTALAAVSTYLSNRTANIIAAKTAEKLRKRALAALYKAPLGVIDNTAAGETASKITGDIDMITDGLTASLSQLITGAVTIAGTIGFMLSINYVVTFAVAALTPLSMLFAVILTKRMRRLFTKNAEIKGKLSASALDIAGNLKLLKLYGMEDRAAEQFDGINKDLYKVGFDAQFTGALVNPGTRLINAFVYAAVTLLGAYYAVTGGITVGELSCFLAYTYQYSKPFNEITSVISELQSALAGAERVFRIIDTTPETDNGRGTLQAVNGEIEMTDISFSYQKDKKFIENLNASFPAGKKIAVIGASGCGKTTLINLIMRFYGIDSGQIKIDGTDTESLSLTSLRSAFGMVLQEGVIFNRSVKENIAFARPDATMDEIIEAAKNANAHGFIEQLKEGYDTVLDDASSLLSVGQQQLLCIARVMLSKPKIVILDEATSNIDTRTEQAVHSAFLNLAKGKTAIVVAHRLATIADSDLIIVMDNGKIIESGSPKELINLGGYYAEAIKLSMD